MLEKYNVRTDLALEEKERFESDQVEIPGVILEEEYEEELEIQITKVKIETENGAKSMGKPVGVYLTIEAPKMEQISFSCKCIISPIFLASFSEISL